MKKDENIVNQVLTAIKNVENEIPLINCITNAVTINDCANAILAIGGSPTMAEDIGDIVEFIQIADSLVINMGKLDEKRIEVILKACRVATETKTPIILDPVGVGVTKLRNELAIKLIKNYNITAIRGNITEIKAMANLLKIKELENIPSHVAKGVDASEYDIINYENLNENSNVVKSLAKKINAVIIASGPIDIISNGKSTYKLENGDPMMSKITGSGCMLSSIVGTFIGVNDALIGSIAATLSIGIAGENAGKYVKEDNSGTGTFRTKLIDYLYLLNEKDIKNNSKIYEIND